MRALESGDFWSIMRTWNLTTFGDIWGAECLRSLVDNGTGALVLEGSYILRESEGKKFWEFGGQGVWGILRVLESGAREPKDSLGRDQGNGSPCHLPWASQAQVLDQSFWSWILFLFDQCWRYKYLSILIYSGHVRARHNTAQNLKSTWRFVDSLRITSHIFWSQKNYKSYHLLCWSLLNYRL